MNINEEIANLNASSKVKNLLDKFACVECGYENNADLVGVINILNRGIKMLEGQDATDASVGCASTAQIACEVNGAVCSAAGTHRSDSGVAQCLA